VLQLRRLVLTAIAAAALWVPSGATAATTVEPFPADFTMTSATCPNLPPGTTINGTGVGRSVTKTFTDPLGITRVFNSSIAPGTATDQAGNHYRFLYSNQFWVANSKANPKEYRGLMVDVFTLHGDGPARLHNGFLARFTTDLGASFSLDPIFAFGDPLDFATGEAHCDPL
jgi:hypothetical protein